MNTGEQYFWWNDAHRKLSEDVREYADNAIAPRIREIEDTKRFACEEEAGRFLDLDDGFDDDEDDED